MSDYKELVAELRKWQTLGDAPVGNGFGVIVGKLTLKQAADAIEQLVAECNRLQSVYDEIDKAHHDTFLMYRKMKHERDAAVADCKIILEDGVQCNICKHYFSEDVDACIECENKSNFEWRKNSAEDAKMDEVSTDD